MFKTKGSGIRRIREYVGNSIGTVCRTPVRQPFAGIEKEPMANAGKHPATDS